MRSTRKLEHLRLAMKITSDQGDSGFGDISLVPWAMPEIDLAEVDASCHFLGKSLTAPILINAMTGGHLETQEVNSALARAAQEAGLAIAVGSQRAALENKSLRETYVVVRRNNPDGVVLANLNAGCTPDDALRAVEMLNADGIQLYLNPAQELAMAEGDPNFRNVLENLSRVKEVVNVPVIIKEVGFGLSGEIVACLRETGVDFVDVGGRGGTNFIAIERMRGGRRIGEEMLSWGLPTAIALAEAVHFWPGRVIASGGIRTGLDIAKALALGASLTGIARPFLAAYKNGPEAVVKLALGLIENLRAVMFLVGAQDIATLQTRPVVITGYPREWLQERGLNPGKYAQRGYVRNVL